MSQSSAARAVGRSAAWGSGQPTPTLRALRKLHPEAERALDDFEFFRRAYFGHLSLPWQLELVDVLERLTATDVKEYLRANEPPGTGKTTTLLDYLTWRIVRSRRVRCLYGSKVAKNAEDGVALVRRYLTTEVPIEPDEDDVEAGVAVVPWRVLAHDFGSFRPLTRDLPWKATGFSVEQYDGAPLPFKEPTLGAYGQNSGVLGGRFDVVVWDDLVDLETTSTPDQLFKQQRKWDSELESRLQPRGVMALVGQRIAAGDLYQYVGEKTYVDDDGQTQPKYHHVVFPAHSDDLCTGNHGKDEARPWPHGCLLDPVRLPWGGKGGIRQIAENTPHIFEVWYQQRDGDPDGALIRDVWLTGGVDHHDGGKLVPGCWDTDRRYGDMPRQVVKGSVRVGSVDPSPSKHWAVNDVIAVKGGVRILVDTFDGKMSANELLDFDLEMREFKGIMHTWQMRSIEQGMPIRTWIVEDNSANKFLLPYDHVKRWCQTYKVTIVPHTTTGKNKLDPNLGPDVLKEPHRAGMWRYARGDIQSVRKTDVIRQQLTTFPSPASRSDQVMSLWFVEYRLPMIFPADKQLPLLPRASWQRRRAS